MRANNAHKGTPWPSMLRAPSTGLWDSWQRLVASEPKHLLGMLCDKLGACLQPLSAPRELLQALLLSAATTGSCSADRMLPPERSQVPAHFAWLSRADLLVFILCSHPGP